MPSFWLLLESSGAPPGSSEAPKSSWSLQEPLETQAGWGSSAVVVALQALSMFRRDGDGSVPEHLGPGMDSQGL